MKQMPIRVPDELITRIDERAEKVGLSRNAWLTKAIEWALDQPVTTRTIKQQI